MRIQRDENEPKHIDEQRWKFAGERKGESVWKHDFCTEIIKTGESAGKLTK